MAMEEEKNDTEAHIRELLAKAINSQKLISEHESGSKNSKEAVESAANSVRNIENEIRGAKDRIAAFENSSATAKSAAETAKNDVEGLKNAAAALKDQITIFKADVETAKTTAEQKRDEIIKVHNEVENIKKTAQLNQDEISQLKSDADEKIAMLTNESEIVLGDAKKQFSELSSSAEAKAKESFAILDAAKLEQQKFFGDAKLQHEKLIDDINLRLSPAATTNELTFTFKEKVEKFQNDGDKWAKWFIAAVLLAIFILTADLFTDTPILSDWKDIWLRIAPRLPLMGFFIWLIMFLANRRAEAKKLEESYKHKEVMARSYTGYRKAIEELDENDTGLLKKHMDNLLESINDNSSAFLTPNGEKWPLLHFIVETFTGRRPSKND